MSQQDSSPLITKNNSLGTDLPLEHQGESISFNPPSKLSKCLKVWKVLLWMKAINPCYWVFRVVGLGLLFFLLIKFPSDYYSGFDHFSIYFDYYLRTDCSNNPNNTFYGYSEFNQISTNIYIDDLNGVNESILYAYPDRPEVRDFISKNIILENPYRRYCNLTETPDSYCSGLIDLQLKVLNDEKEFNNSINMIGSMSSYALRFGFNPSGIMNSLQVYSANYNLKSQLINELFSNYYLQQNGLNLSVSGSIAELPEPELPTVSSGIFVSLFSLMSTSLFAHFGLFHMNYLISERLVLLLTISGAPEYMIWIGYHLIDVILLIINSFVNGCLICSISTFKPYLDFSTIQIGCILSGLSIWAFGIFFAPLFKKSIGPSIIAFALIAFECIIGGVIPVAPYPKPSTRQSSIRPLLLFLPPFSAVHFYLDVAYSCSYLNTSFSFKTLDQNTYAVRASQCLAYLFYSFILYLGLYIILLNLMPRIAGSPPIGWANLFSKRFWSSFFAKSHSVSPENLTIGEDAIAIENISKSYFGRPTIYALNEVSFRVRVGETIVLIGPNGCGKSTLINSMTGSLIADDGKITLFGQPATFKDMQKYVGICFQDNIFFQQMTVYNHLKFFGSLRGASEDKIKEQIDTFTEQLELQDVLHAKAKDLSGGQKRKLCIALAFIGNPAIVILDEPTAGIDASARQTIWKAIANFNGTTSFISSHALEEAESVCTRLFAMNQGRIVFQGSPNNLREEYHCGYIFHPIGSQINMEALIEFMKRFIPETKIDEGKPDQILMPKSKEIGPMLQQLHDNYSQFGINNFTLLSEALEDVLLRLISQ